VREAWERAKRPT